MDLDQQEKHSPVHERIASELVMWLKPKFYALKHMREEGYYREFALERWAETHGWLLGDDEAMQRVVDLANEHLRSEQHVELIITEGGFAVNIRIIDLARKSEYDQLPKVGTYGEAVAEAERMYGVSNICHSGRRSDTPITQHEWDDILESRRSLAEVLGRIMDDTFGKD